MFEIEDINEIIYEYLDVFDLVDLSRTTRAAERRLRGRLRAARERLVTCTWMHLGDHYRINSHVLIADGRACVDTPTSIQFIRGWPIVTLPIHLASEIRRLKAKTLVVTAPEVKMYVYAVGDMSTFAARLDARGMTIWRPKCPMSIHDRLHDAALAALGSISLKYRTYEDRGMAIKIAVKFPNVSAKSLLPSRRMLEFMAGQ